VLLAPMLAAEPDLADWHALTDVLHRWHWARKPLAATINILSVALYDLFSAEGAYCMSHLAAGSRCDSHLCMSYVRNQMNTSPIYGLGASSISSAAVNAYEVQSLCFQGESSRPRWRSCTLDDDVLTRTSDLLEIPSYSSTTSLPWRSTLPGFSWHTHGK
jgi:hypothetical protein